MEGTGHPLRAAVPIARLIGLLAMAVLVGCAGTPTEPGATGGSPTPGALASPTASAAPVRGAQGETVRVRGAADIAVTAARETAAESKLAGYRVVLVYVKLETGSRPLTLTRDMFALTDRTLRSFEPLAEGASPVLELPATIDATSTAQGYLAFEVPIGGAYEFRFTTQDGAAHVALNEFAPAPTPRPTSTPLRTPRPTSPATPTTEALPNLPTLDRAYFRGVADVSWYDVSGSTEAEIVASIEQNGPYSDWIGARAEGQTRQSTTYRFTLQSDGSGACQIVIQQNPPVVMEQIVTLPEWTPPAGVRPELVEWWVDRLLETAVHERKHVDFGVAATTRANSVVRTSTCANVEARLDDVAADLSRQHCEFDVREYGARAGLTLQSCLAASS